MKVLKFISIAAAVVTVVTALAAVVTVYSKKYKKNYITVCE